MANKQRDSRPGFMSPEETRVRPPEEDEAPPEDEQWESPQDSTQLVTNVKPPKPGWEDPEGDEATPPFPRNLPAPATQEPDEATRPIPRAKTSSRPALQEPDDATRPIPRAKTSSRPALQEPVDATRPIPRAKTSSRPGLTDSRSGARKTSTRRALEDAPAVPWAAQPDGADPRAPTPQAIAPITDVSYVSTAPLPALPAAMSAAAPPPRQSPSGPHAPIPITTQPIYAPESPPVLTPVVTAPQVLTAPIPSAAAAPPGEELRTAFSNKAALIADLVRATFARRTYGIAPYRLRIDEPDGPSTAGGLLARQPISLVSNQESAPAIVCGWVDVSKKESQLRSYGAVVKRHQSRHGAELDITAEEYERFLNELVDTLFYGGIKVLVLIPDEQEPATPAQAAQAQQQQQRATSRSALATFFLLVLAFALGLGVGALNAERLAPLLGSLQASDTSP